MSRIKWTRLNDLVPYGRKTETEDTRTRVVTGKNEPFSTRMSTEIAKRMSTVIGTRPCAHCGERFELTEHTRTKRYCNKKCRSAYRVAHDHR